MSPPFEPKCFDLYIRSLDIVQGARLVKQRAGVVARILSQYLKVQGHTRGK